MNRQVFTIPNAITLVRLAALPAVAWLLPRPGTVWALVVLFTLITLSDFLDGYVARRLGQVTDLGILLDPLADKICLLTLGVLIFYYRGLPFWLLLVIVGKNVLIAAGAACIIHRRRSPTPPKYIGKVTLGWELALMMVYAFQVQVLKPAAITGLIVLSAATLVVYARIFVIAFPRQDKNEHCVK